MTHSDSTPEAQVDRQQRPTGEWTEPRLLEVPEPTYWPAMTALAVVTFLFGFLTSWVISLVGFVLFVVSMKEWIGELTRDV